VKGERADRRTGGRKKAARNRKGSSKPAIGSSKRREVTSSLPPVRPSARPALLIDVVTLFPEVIAPYLAASIPGRAAAAGLVQFRLVQLRNFTHDRHATVDDYAYGGGAGMVLKPEPFFEAVETLRPTGPIVLLSARGRRFTHDDAVRFSLGERLTLLCGHYKDVDQRVADGLATEELSIGDFVLSGGEPAALCVLDAVVRLLPDAISDHESASSDSHYDGMLSPPSYTRPPEYRGLTVPEVLRSGNHAEIEAWRQAESERLTRERRPDLWERYDESSRDDKSESRY
jgi:tRNA (guanine37-N1)-methyltransferase